MLAVCQAAWKLIPLAARQTVLPATSGPFIPVGYAPRCITAEPDPAGSERTSVSPAAFLATQTTTTAIRAAWFSEPQLPGALPDKLSLSSELLEDELHLPVRH